MKSQDTQGKKRSLSCYHGSPQAQRFLTIVTDDLAQIAMHTARPACIQNQLNCTFSHVRI